MLTQHWLNFPRSVLHLCFLISKKEDNCREREPEHVTKTPYTEQLRTCPETRRVYHVTKSFNLLSRFMLHNFEEIE